MNGTPTSIEKNAADTNKDALQAAMRFVRVLRYRKSYVLVSVVIAGLLGTVYYATATRIYQASAALLVLQAGEGVFNTSLMSEDRGQTLIPTYERLFSSAIVLKGALEQLGKMPPAARIDFEGIPADRWEETLRKGLLAKAARRTNVIEITFHSKSPVAAEAVVSAVVQSYLDFMEKNHKDVSAEIVTILDRERRDLDTALHKRQSELLELQRQVRTLGLGEGDRKAVHPIVQRVLSLNEALIDVQKERVTLEGALASLQGAIRSGGDLREHLALLDPAVGRDLLSTTLGLNPQAAEVAGEMEKKLIDDRAKLDMLSSRLGPAHPQVLEVTRSIQNTERYLFEFAAKTNERLNGVRAEQLPTMLVSMVQEKLAQAWSHERELSLRYTAAEDEAVQLNDQHAELAMVELDVTRLRKLHDSLLDRISHIDLGKDHSSLRVAVVGEPTAPLRPISPRLSIVGLLCLVAGLGAGAAAVYVIDLLDDRFRSPEELREQLGVPVLAVVRKLSILAEAGAKSLHVHMAAESVESEAFRTLRTTLAFSGNEIQRIAITSSEPGDGKTTVISNLGASFAQAGRKTLLIDADMRRPGLSRLFAMRGWTGLSETLRASEDVAGMCAERVYESGVPGLFILPCGSKPSDPAELLSRPRLAEIIAWAESHYDQVLVDCPPMLAASDAALVGRLTDGVVMVVQPEKNHRRLVLRAAEGLTSVQVNLIGIVANKVGGEGQAGYYGYGSGYGYGYGYGYGDGYGQESDESDDVDEPTEDADAPDDALDSAPPPPEQGVEPAKTTRIVPRRAA